MYHGDIRLGDTIDIKVTTVNSIGAPTTLAGSPVVSAYPGNSVTQLTAGITLTVDFDSVTGLNNIRVVASSGNGYATATNYALVITAGTVGGDTVVGYTIATFSIEARSALMPTTAARTLDVSTGGAAGVDWANVETPGSTVSLSATTVATVTTTTTATNVTNAPTAGDLTATMKASVNAEVVDAVSTDTISELAQAAPAATPTMRTALMLLYMMARNKLDVTASDLKVTNDAGTVIAKKALTDDGTTYAEAEMVTGP